MGADPDADYRHAGDGYRLPCSDFRGLLPDPSGSASGLSVADAHYPYLGNGVGQIYIPFINWLLYVSVVIVIVSFEHSSNGGGVWYRRNGHHGADLHSVGDRGTQNWHWNKLFVGLMLVAFLCIDIPLFSANLDKIVSGGWLPLSRGW